MVPVQEAPDFLLLPPPFPSPESPEVSLELGDGSEEGVKNWHQVLILFLLLAVPCDL